MQFPPFAHAAWLGEAWKDGAPRHDLGASGFRSPVIDSLLPRDRDGHDVEGIDLYASIRLRDEVARMHGVKPTQVRITCGTSAANAAALAMLITPGSHVVSERPSYAPLAALAEGFGARVTWVEHGPDGLDAQAMADACTPDTVALLVTSPNNPTGRPLTAAQFKILGDGAAQVGAYVVADQVYQQLTEHALGLHPNVIVTAGLNKCWGAPGLRVGWAIGNEAIMVQLEEVHRLLSLAPNSWSTRMASELIHHEAACKQALADHLAAAHPIYREWCQAQGLPDDVFGLTALAPIDVDARALLAEGILVVPGSLFGGSGARLGFGGAIEKLPESLAALGAVIRTQRF